MKITDNKITEATESELYDYYISRGYDILVDFITYYNSMVSAGVKIINADYKNLEVDNEVER